MNQLPNNKHQITKQGYDLEDRILRFAMDVRSYSRILEKNLSNREDLKQLIRSSGSIGANYIEANESLSDKDKIMRMKIARKEARESTFWLKLLHVKETEEPERVRLLRECDELTKILSVIVKRLES